METRPAGTSHFGGLPHPARAVIVRAAAAQMSRESVLGSWLSPSYFKRELWATDLRRAGLFTRFRIKLLRLAVVVAWEFNEHALSLRATGLVYATLLSLVPFLAVAFSVLKAFGVHMTIAPVLDRFLAPLGPTGSDITNTLVSFVDNVKVGVLGAAGIAGLFITVITLVEKVEDAFNQIWRIRQPRSLARKFSDYLSVVLVGPVLVFTAFGLIASAQHYPIVQRVLQIHIVGKLLVVVMGHLMPFLFLCGAFTFMYRLVPHTRVRLVSALVGGATAALLWQVASVAFAAFIASSKQYSAIYSSFAIMVVFLLWLYYAWLVVLVGAEVAYFHQHPVAYLAFRRRPTHLFRERLALAAMIEIARRHIAGEPPATVDGLSSGLNVPLTTLEELIEDFVRGGLLLRTAEPPGVALARPPEQMSVREILDRVRAPDDLGATVFGERLEAADHALRLRDEAARQAVEGLTLRSIVSEAPQSEPETVAPALRVTESLRPRKTDAA
jgi:membrane protein